MDGWVGDYIDGWGSGNAMMIAAHACMGFEKPFEVLCYVLLRRFFCLYERKYLVVSST